MQEEINQKGSEKKFVVRLGLTALMGIFVVLVMCVGTYSMIKDMADDAQTGQKLITKNNKNAGESLDVSALVKELQEKVAFDTELEELEDSVAEGMITAEDGTKLQMYMGNGSYADEIVIMTAKNETAAKKDQKSAEAHLKEMQSMFQDYLPKEAKKIDSAIRVRCGCYVIVCVTSDADTAKQIIQSYVGG